MAGARRYTKWTPEHTQKVCEALRAGNTRRAACIYAGVSEDSLARWLQKAEVADAIQKAEADAEVRNVAIIQKAAGETWFAAAWWLERKRPEDWGRKDKLDHGGALKVNVVYADRVDPDAAEAAPGAAEGPE
jgi:transposase